MGPEMSTKFVATWFKSNQLLTPWDQLFDTRPSFKIFSKAMNRTFKFFPENYAVKYKWTLDWAPNTWPPGTSQTSNLLQRIMRSGHPLETQFRKISMVMIRTFCENNAWSVKYYYINNNPEVRTICGGHLSEILKFMLNKSNTWSWCHLVIHPWDH